MYSLLIYLIYRKGGHTLRDQLWSYSIVVIMVHCLCKDRGSTPRKTVCNVLENGNSIPPADFLLDN
jgi:hypothetical protein